MIHRFLCRNLGSTPRDLREQATEIATEIGNWPRW